MSSTPAGTVDNISIGSGIVYIGDAGVTPTTDIGYLGDDGITLTYETETVEVTVGFPATPVRQFVSAVTAGLTFQSLEWNLANFERAVVGNRTVTATEEILAVGLDACPDEVALEVQFCMPCVDDTILLRCWRGQTDGALEIGLQNDSPHTFNYNFRLLLAQEDWATNPLPAEEGLFQIRRQFAP